MCEMYQEHDLKVPEHLKALRNKLPAAVGEDGKETKQAKKQR